MKTEVEEVEVISTPRNAAVEIEDLTGSAPSLVTVPAIRTALAGEVDVTGSIDRVRQYAGASQQFARASLAMQVMAGMELTAIKAGSPYQRGGVRRGKSNPHEGLGSNPHRAGLIENANESAETPTFTRHKTWEEFLLAEFGLSADTAARWMAMADAARSRLKRLDGFGALIRDLLERPICDLSTSEVEVLAKSVAKITDGRTQLDFLQELGLVKKPGNPSLGGATSGGGRKALGTIDADKIRDAAAEEWGMAEKALLGMGMTFTVLPDSQIEAQLDVLTRALRARREWLAAAANERTPSLVDSLAKSLR